MNTKLCQILIAGWLIFAPIALHAQLGLNLDVQGGYASNIVSSYRQIPDTYQDFLGQLHYRLVNPQTGLQIAYRFELTRFDRNPSRNNQTHIAGLDFYYSWLEKDNKLSAGIEGRNRLNSKVYDWSEYRQGRVYIGYKALLTSQLFAYFGWDGRMRTYPQLEPFSYWQNRGYLRLTRFFDSGTTMIMQIEALQKDYLDQSAIKMVPGFPELISIGDGASRQLLATMRLAQSLSPTAGLSADLSLRRNLTNAIRTLGTADGYYYSDDEMFDDPFGYEAEGLELALKKRLLHGWMMEIGGEALAKHYPNRLALDLAGEAFADQRIREDNRTSLWFSLRKSLRTHPDLNPATLTFDLSWQQNRSNDPYYDYHLTAFSFGIKHNF